jgi:hypothetical protein
MTAVLPSRSSAGFRLVYSQSYHGVPQQCTGKDQLMLARGPWENEPILICGVSLTHRVYPPSQEAFAMAGTSAIDGDILCHVSGSATVNIFYPEGTGFLLPGRPAEAHIDVHAWSGRGTTHEVWLTVYYYKSLEDVPVPTPIPSPDNNKLSEIVLRHPVYQSAPPEPPSLSERIGARMLWLIGRRKLPPPQFLRKNSQLSDDS